jgi:2'-5' RNA ligase
MVRGTSDLLRLFVAVELPPEVLEKLTQLQTALRRRGLDGLRWARPEGIHLTLKFLGETPADRVSAIREALARAADGVPSHRLSLGEMGTFGSRRMPRVLWVNLKGGVDALGDLQRRVEDELEREGFPRERRKFSPHLTLARVRQESAGSVGNAIEEALRVVSPPDGVVEVNEVSLMRSTLRPSGAIYERLAAFRLR